MIVDNLIITASTGCLMCHRAFATPTLNTNEPKTSGAQMAAIIDAVVCSEHDPQFDPKTPQVISHSRSSNTVIETSQITSHAPP